MKDKTLVFAGKDIIDNALDLPQGKFFPLQVQVLGGGQGLKAFGLLHTRNGLFKTDIFVRKVKTILGDNWADNYHVFTPDKVDHFWFDWDDYDIYPIDQI